MHPTLEIAVLEDQVKKKHKQNKKKPPKQKDHDRHLFPQALWLAGRGRLRSGRFLQEEVQYQSPSHTRCWDAS